EVDPFPGILHRGGDEDNRIAVADQHRGVRLFGEVPCLQDELATSHLRLKNVYHTLTYLLYLPPLTCPETKSLNPLQRANRRKRFRPQERVGDTKERAGLPALLLSAQTELLNEPPVPCDILLLQVVQESAALADHLIQ